jgi:hypothetical protein
MFLLVGWFAGGNQSLAQGVAEPDVNPAVANAAQTHVQTASIPVGTDEDKMQLVHFCVCHDGRLLALTISRSENSVLPLLYAPVDDSSNTRCEVRVLQGNGDEISRFPVPFVAQAINTFADKIYVGGNGQLAAFGFDGVMVKQSDAPQVAALQKDPEALEQLAVDDLKTQKESNAEQIKSMEDVVQLLEKQVGEEKKEHANEKAQSAADNSFGLGSLLQFFSSDAAPAASQQDIAKQQLEMVKNQVASLNTRTKQLENKTAKDVVKEIVAAAQKVNSITANEQDVFISCRAATGYGFSVWRLTTEFSEPKRIVDQLVGCCGQMDCECIEGDLYVAENARHRVVHYDREGKLLNHFGKTDRSGVGDSFGGCCNPMNLCFTSQSELYVSESNGVVKRFKSDGEFCNVVGIAQVEAGCKNSAVGVAAVDSKIYYIDIQHSRILVLTKKATQDTAQASLSDQLELK